MFFNRFLLTILFVSFSSFALSFEQPSCHSVSIKTCEVAKGLGKGINMGNMLEAPNEGDWGKLRLEPRFARLVSDFSNVRIPIRWSNHASLDDKAIIEPWFFRRVDRAIQDFIENDQYVVINMHHYIQLFSGKVQKNEAIVAPEDVEKRLYNLWEQIAEHYKNASPKLIFEILNEPHGRITPEKWNVMMPKLLKIIRKSNPDRTVIIGPAKWNSPGALNQLKVPADKNIIITVHPYHPYNFTHQGIAWLPWKKTGVTCCSNKQKKEIIEILDYVKKWSDQKGYPIYVGEFGVHNKADQYSRVSYASFVTDEFEKRGFSWAYWEFASSFGFYNPKKGKWNHELKDALLK